MTADWFDLGLRLHAATHQRPARRLTHSPVITGTSPVAVRARNVGDTVRVDAASPDAVGTATGADALRLLADLGVMITAPQPVTLVSDQSGTVAALTRLARGALDGPGESVAAHIGWWADRADYPGGGAVVDLLAASRTFWATGTTPTAERRADTWRTWLGLAEDTVSGLLIWHRLLTDAPPLRWLDALHNSDLAAYRHAQHQHTEGRDWRWPDSPARAALGLKERCDAADLYAAALLTDPTYRRRAVHTGDVVTGTATRLPGRSRRLDVTCARLDARLRPGSDVTGWIGGATTSAPEFSGQVTAATVTGARLHLTLIGVTGAAPDHPRTPVTLTPAPPSPGLQHRGRANLRALYGSRRSWLTTGRTPTPTRRDVPLDVLVAGADDH